MTNTIETDAPMTLNQLFNAAAEGLDSAARNLLMFADDYAQAQAALFASHRVNIVAARDEFEHCKGVLKSLVESNPSSFSKPRSRTIEGVEFGMRKTPPSVEFEFDDEFTLALIDDTLPKKVARLIAPIKREVLLAPLKGLDEKQLRDIGASFKQSETCFVNTPGDDAFKRTKEFS
jgi:hypothetical protein